MRFSSVIGYRLFTSNTFFCLFLSGCFGAIWGGIVGAVYGGFYFPLFGNLYGLFLGAFGGWVAGLIGVILNHRIGFKIGGVVGSLFCTVTILGSEAFRMYNVSFVVVPLVLAFLLGMKIDKDLSDTGPFVSFHLGRILREGTKTSGARPYQWLRERLDHSTLSEWSLGKRLFWVGVVVLVHGFLIFYVLPWS